jgi:hypothetical protein
MIKFISLKIVNIKNSKDQLNALALLSSDISMIYSMFILDDDRIQLNFLNEEIANIKASAEMELKWTEWKNNLRNALKEKIDEEWKKYISKTKDFEIATINYDYFNIEFKTNVITNTSKEKFISISFYGNLNSKIEPRFLGFFKKESNNYLSKFNGTYNSKYTIGNDPYLEKVNINFQVQ